MKKYISIGLGLVIILGGFFVANSALAAICNSNSNGNWNTAGTWSCGHVPNSTDDVTITATRTIAFNPASGIVKSLTVDGTLNFNNASNNSLTVSGNVINNGSIVVVNQGGTRVHPFNIAGNLINNGIFTTLSVNDSLNIVFNGTSTQTIGGSSAITFNNLTINNAQDIILSISPTISGTLTQTSGKFLVTATADAKSKTYNASDPALTYTITNALVSGDSFTGALSRVAGENVGTYAINKNTLSSTNSSRYILTYVGANLTITQASSATTVTCPASETYTGSAITPCAVLVAGVGGLSLTPNPVYANNTNVGTASASYTFDGDLNHSGSSDTKNFDIVAPAFSNQTITVATYAPASAEYNSTFPVTATASSSLPVNITTEGGCSGSGSDSASITMTSGTASCIVHYNQAGNGSYNPAPEVIETTAALQLSIAVTADSQTKIYGDVDPVLSYKLTNGSLVDGDSFSGSLIRDAGENIGDYAINQGDLSAGSNYDLTFGGNNLTINKRDINATADAKAKVYGEADSELTYTHGTLFFADDFSGILSRVEGEDVGEYVITQGTLSAGGNYNLNYTEANLTITPFEVINVIINSSNKIYGEEDPELTYEFNPVLQGDDSFSGSLARNAGENVGEYAITYDDLSAGDNYVLSFTGNNLTINKKDITVTADNKNKEYGDSDPEFTYTYPDGALVGEDSFAGSLSRNAGENVGTYIITQGTLLAGGNYNLNYTEANLIITDTTAPEITLTGDATVNLTVGDSYSDAGATALDDVDGDITGNIIVANPVNTSAIGTYTVTYNVDDSSGNSATQVTRTVNVNPIPDTTPIASSSGSTHFGCKDPKATNYEYFVVSKPELCKYEKNISIPVTTGQVLGFETFNFTQLLKKGSQGNEVKELQKFLNANEYNSGIVDGFFGNITKTAVIKYQIAKGLDDDGIVGKYTRAKLNSTATIAQASPVVGQILSTSTFYFNRNLKFRDTISPDVKELQNRLRDEGLFNYVSTGYFGFITKNAVIKYQIVKGLKGDGIVGVKTREKLNE